MLINSDHGTDRNIANEKYYFGIDGGATKCRAVLMDNNNTILGVGVAGSGNPVYGISDAQNSIVNAASKALEQAKPKFSELKNFGLNDLVAGIGLAGVNVASLEKVMTQWKSPFKSHYITTDLLIACLGAHNGSDGAVMVSGTGSCGYSFVNAESRIVGAHGFPQGDQGSGAWIGLKGVEAALLSLDSMGPRTTICDQIFKELQISSAEEIVEKVVSKSSSTFASLARCVFAAAKDKDRTALSIVNEGAKYLDNMASTLTLSASCRISLIGGLAETITPFLDDELQKKLSPALSPPEVGAVFYARQQHSIAKQIS